ncbi:sensor histidine kinase [Microbacterium sufflavum]|uniref:histidine kinase n=1 Tax=Microbacterium sufflavum TaxID=2851649 RepID=A0ABY4IIU9_9MICO|nr:sensor histidine kinase [Microbacterium sufflavum]
MTDNAPAAEAGSRPAPWVLDGLLGIGVTLVVSLFIAADIDGAEPDGWAYLWAVGLGALMLARRRHPVVVVVLSAAGVVAYYASGYPAIGIAVPLAAAVFSAAEYGRTGASIATSVTVLVISVAYRLAIGQDPAVVVGYELPGHALLLAAAIALGDNVRSRRELRQKSSQIAALTVERYAREAEKRAMSERLSIARELHDSMGHALTVVTLHAQIAEEALDPGTASDEDSAAAREALAIIASTASVTFEDLRRTVANLRREEGATRPPLGIDDLESAILPATQAGLTVRASVSISAALPSTVEAAVFRIVQESITNVVRHADAARVDVDIRQADDAVAVSIVNDGRPRTTEPSDDSVRPGRGLEGMRERVHLLGGTFSAGPRDAGFAVYASFPLAVRA